MQCAERNSCAGLDASRYSVFAECDSALADDLGGIRIEVDDDAGVLVDPEYEHVVIEFGFEHCQAPLAEVALARVVVATLFVVVVRDDNDRKTDFAQHVEPVDPVRIGARLVDLVDRNRFPPKREGGGRREHDGTAVAELVGNGLRNWRIGPLAQRKGRTAGAGKDPVGCTDLRDGCFDCHDIAVVGSCEASDLDGPVRRVGEVLGGLGGKDFYVFLEPERGIEEHGVNGAAGCCGKLFEHAAMRRGHRRSGFA